MDLMLLQQFQKQVDLQCRFALLAARELDDACTSLDVDRIFYAIQNLLNAAANVSKALWGQAGKKAAQRELLRQSINVTDASPLHVVSIRNDFEHFDERLDQWWSKSKRHNYLDMNIFVGMNIDNSVGKPDDLDVFRNYYRDTAELVFWGQRFKLRELIEEIKRIVPLIQRETAESS